MFANYDPGYPIVVGFAGPPGSGKTSTADFIRPIATAGAEQRSTSIVWEHLWHSIPLYELSTIKRKVQGIDKKDRQLYQIHSVLHDLFRGYIGYDELVELTYDVYAMPIETSGKPRTFLQETGSLLRSHDPDCFARWIKNRTKESFVRHRSDYADSEFDPPPFIMIVSDVRLMNEAQFIKSQPNSAIIMLTADQDVLDNRLMERDGFLPTLEQMAHESEGDRTSPEFLALVDLTVDTTPLLDVQSQGSFIREVITASIPHKELV